MGEQADTESVSTGATVLEELIAGLDPLASWTAGEDTPHEFAVAATWEGWAIAVMVLLGLALMSRAAWMMWRTRTLLKAWPELERFADGKGNREQAEAELRMLEFVAGLRHPETRKVSAAWNKLTPSEQVVAWGTMHDKTVQDLADELACTPSHVYNLRTSIRKKWQLETEESFAQSIRARHHELLTKIRD